MLCLINIFAFYGETVLDSICATSALSSRFSSYAVFKHWAIKWKRQDEEVFKSNEKCKEHLCQYKIRFLQEKNKHNREKELIFQQMNKSSKHNNKIIAELPLSLCDFQQVIWQASHYSMTLQETITLSYVWGYSWFEKNVSTFTKIKTLFSEITFNRLKNLFLIIFKQLSMCDWRQWSNSIYFLTHTHKNYLRYSPNSERKVLHCIWYLIPFRKSLSLGRYLLSHLLRFQYLSVIFCVSYNNISGYCESH